MQWKLLEKKAGFDGSAGKHVEHWYWQSWDGDKSE